MEHSIRQRNVGSPLPETLEFWQQLGEYYASGQENNIDLAIYWLGKAVKYGDGKSRVLLEKLHQEQSEVWYQLGMFYQRPHLRHAQKAKKWLTLAANQGHLKALDALAELPEPV